MDATVAAELKIHRLVAQYCQLIDDGDLDAVLSHFSADGTFCVRGHSYEGRDRIRRFFEATQQHQDRGKHLTTNVVVDIEGERAVVRSDFVWLGIVDGALKPLFTGRYTDEVRLIDGGWVFHRREVTTLGAGPG